MSGGEPLEEAYFQWLYEKYVGHNEHEPATHWKLCAVLQHIPYRWSIPNDDNRAEDGKFLREKFLSERRELRGDHPYGFFAQECSVLEFLIALSERAEFESLSTQQWWFWEMVENLRLLGFNDEFMARNTRRCEEIIWRTVEALLDRNYDRNGRGGLFPLRHPPVDQRTAEVWYQMSTYILEMQ